MGEPGVVLVAYTDADVTTALTAVEVATPPGIEIVRRGCVHQGRFYCSDHDDEVVTLGQAGQTRMDAEFAYQGHPGLAASREALTSDLHTATRPAPATLRMSAHCAVAGLGPAGRAAALLPHTGPQPAEVQPGDVETSLILAGLLTTVEGRTAALAALNRTDAKAMTRVWLQVLHNTPASHAAPVAAYLALLYWQDGQGAQGNHCGQLATHTGGDAEPPLRIAHAVLDHNPDVWPGVRNAALS